MDIQQLTAQLTSFAQNVNVLGHNTTQAVRDLAAQLHATNETAAAQIVAVTQHLGAAPNPTPAPELQQLVQTLAQLPAALHQAQQPPRPTLKLDPPSYNGRGDFREWRRKLELIYDAK